MGELSTEKALGEAIQQARQKAGLTQQELCHQAKISYSTLAKIERGAIKTPSVFTVQRISAVLGVSLDELLGFVVDNSASVMSRKKTSKSGVSFLYLDVNGCLVRFFHGAFTMLAHETGIPSDAIESAFWHYNDAVCRGEISLEKFNENLAKSFGVKEIDWEKYYMDAVEPITAMHDLVLSASRDYKIGLLTNIMPDFITKMIQNGLLPDIKYDAIVDSSIVKSIKPEKEIYEIALKKAGVAPEHILFVDDSRTNLMAAERLGWKVMWFNDYHPQESVDRINSALEL